MAKILVIEDDTALAEIIQGWLSREKHQCEVVNDGTDARTRVKTYDYDMIILDWELPGCRAVSTFSRNIATRAAKRPSSC